MKEGERCNVKLKVSSGEGPTRPRFVDVPSAQGRWRWRRTVLEVLRVWDRGELWSFMAGCRVGMVWGEHGVGQPETTVLSQSFSPRPDTQSRAHFSSSRWESELSVSFFFLFTLSLVTREFFEWLPRASYTRRFFLLSRLLFSLSTWRDYTRSSLVSTFFTFKLSLPVCARVN